MSIILVTGSNAGLGFHCVEALAKMPEIGTIILACRNTTAANTAAASIVNKCKCAPERLVVLPEPCNLSELESVRQYAAAVKKYLNGRSLTTLVNNAGIGGSSTWSKNSAGSDMIFATNHLGHYLLTLLLLPTITDRIVNVSSEVHDPETKTPLPDPGIDWPKNEAEYQSLLLRGEPLPVYGSKNGQLRYSRSKLCNVFFTNELALRTTGAIPITVEPSVAAAATTLPQKSSCKLSNAKQVKCVAFNPGLMLDTDFVKNIMGGIIGAFAWFLLPVLRMTSVEHVLRSGPLSGGRLARIATGKILSDSTAAFVSDETPHPSSEFSRSMEGLKYQRELWEHSAKWAEMTSAEMQAAGF